MPIAPNAEAILPLCGCPLAEVALELPLLALAPAVFPPLDTPSEDFARDLVNLPREPPLPPFPQLSRFPVAPCCWPFHCFFDPLLDAGSGTSLAFKTVMRQYQADADTRITNHCY